MKIVRLENNTVAEIVPTDALPVSKWYGEDFAAQCIESPDSVGYGWVYDPKTKLFSPPPEPGSPEPDEITLIKAQVQSQADREEFLEDCIAEMAMELYG